MNSKHLASVMLIAVVCGLLLGINKLKQQMQVAVDAASAAVTDHRSASDMLGMATTGLEFTRKKSAPHRKFFSMWENELARTKSETNAKNEFDRMLKRFPGLAQFGTNVKQPTENKDNFFINKRVAAGVGLEGDLHKILQLVSSFERELPASRISSVELKKGTRANDVVLDLLVDFPLVNPDPAPAPSVAKK